MGVVWNLAAQRLTMSGREGRRVHSGLSALREIQLSLIKCSHILRGGVTWSGWCLPCAVSDGAFVFQIPGGGGGREGKPSPHLLPGAAPAGSGMCGQRMSVLGAHALGWGFWAGGGQLEAAPAAGMPCSCPRGQCGQNSPW